MAENQKTRKRLEELLREETFQQLTGPQRTFVAKYLSGSYDAVAAVRTAYKVASEKNARILSYEILANPRIKKVIQIAMNLSEREAFLIDLEKNIARSSGVARIQAMRLYAKMKFGIDDEPDAACEAKTDDPKLVSKIGDIVLVDGAKFRVTETDANGKPTAGDPL